MIHLCLVHKGVARIQKDLCRRVRKGYEVYKVKRGKFSEKVTINENDFRLSEKPTTKGEVSKKSFTPKEERWHPKNPPSFKDGNTTRSDSSVSTPLQEDWDSERPNVNVVHNADNLKECWDNELATPGEDIPLKVNDTVGRIEHQLSSKDRELSPSVSSDVKGKKDTLVNKQDARGNTNTLTSTSAQSSSLNHGKNNEGKTHSQSTVEESKPIIRKEEDRGEQNMPNHKPKEEKTGSSFRRGMGRGRRNKESHTVLQGRSVQMREGKDEGNSRIVSKQERKENHPLGQSGNSGENTKLLPQKYTHDKKHHEKGKFYDKTTKDAKKKVQFSNEQDETNCSEDISNKDTLNSRNRTAGILVLPSPINEGNESYDVQQDEHSIASKEFFEKKTGFSKLERPNSFDQNKPRGDAKFVKEKKGDLLARKKDLRVSSSSNEIWGVIQSECNRLQKLLSDDLTRLDDIEKILELSIFLQDLYKELIVKHFEFSFKNDVEGSLWKNTFHNVITAFRTIMNKQEPRSFLTEAFQFYWNFLQDGEDFLKDLLSLLQEECKFDLEAFFNNPLKMAKCKKQVKVVHYCLENLLSLFLSH